MISELELSHSTTFLVPFRAFPSSSLVIIKEILPIPCIVFLISKKSETAAMKAAIPDFISAAPLPHIFPSFISPPNGSTDQLLTSPVGTTSTWPAKQIFGSISPSLAYKFSTFSRPSPKSIRLQWKPKDSKYDIIISRAPADFGVMLSHLINSEVKSIGFTFLDIKYPI